LVETLAGLFWRKRRLLQYESAEISKRIDFLEKDSEAALQVHALDYAQPAGTSVGKTIQNGNLAAVRAAINCLGKLQLCHNLAAEGFDARAQREMRESLFGNKDKNSVDDRDYQEVIRVIGQFTKGAKIEGGQFAKVKDEALDAEMKRVVELYNDLLLTEYDRVKVNLRAARIPSEEVSDRILRNETHLSREIDRTLNRLERLQRIRQGKPLPPQVDVKIT